MSDKIKLCNCALCNQLLVTNGTYEGAETLGGRIKGRPHCEECLETNKSKIGKHSVLMPRRRREPNGA